MTASPQQFAVFFFLLYADSKRLPRFLLSLQSFWNVAFFGRLLRGTAGRAAKGSACTWVSWVIVSVANATPQLGKG